MDGCRAIHEETYMMILLFSVLNDEQRALVERIFHEHHIHFQRISFNIVKSEETAEDVVSTAFIKIMDNIEKISDLPGPQMTAFCVTIVKTLLLTCCVNYNRVFTLITGTIFRTRTRTILKMNVFTMPMYIG